ncbi:MAG: DUF3105 domain-containing protein [Candidatus Bipolaricaulia bacterium]
MTSQQSPSEQAEASASKSTPSTSVALRVNGGPITTSQLDREFQKLLGRYKERYVQQGQSLKEALKGPSGAYLELQIRYQAAQSLIERALIDQKARERGLSVKPSKLAKAVEKRFQGFLNDNGMTEEQLRSILQNPEKRQIAQRLLGISDPSLEAFKQQLRQEERHRLLKANLVHAIAGSDVEPGSEEANKALDKWLQKAKSDSKIRYVHPLLRAYHREQQLTSIDKLDAKLAQLQKAIAAYKTARQQTDHPHVDYFLGQLYNLRVNWSSAQKRRLTNDGTGTGASSSAQSGSSQVASLKKAIGESREQATALLSPYQLQNERQLRKMLQADPANPLYKYMYAKFLLKSDDSSHVEVIRMLERALELNDSYVDAYVLYGDVRQDQLNYQAAIKRYRQAIEAYSKDVRSQFRQTNRKTIQHKLAKAQLGYARKLSEAEDGANAEAKRTRLLKEAHDRLRSLKAELENTSGRYARVLADLGEVAMLRNQYADAQAHFRSSLEAENRASVRVRLGDAYRKAEQWEQAEAAYRKALAQQAGYAPAHRGLARLFQARGKSDQAQRHYEQAFVKGDQLSYAERRSVAQEALDANPDDVSVRLRLGQFYLQRNVYEGAMEEFRAVLDHQSPSVQARLGIGRVHLGRAKPSQALAEFRKALDAASTPSERIQAYEWIIKAEQRVVGPGKPLSEAGQRAMWQQAQLYAQTGQYTKSYQTLLDLRENYPNFRPKQVKRRIEEVTSAETGDHRPGKETPNQGASIIEPGEDHAAYATTPPTSGPHYVIPADWGIHGQPIQDEVQLRNIAGGGVMIQYKPALSEDAQAKLRKLVRSLRQDEGQCRLVLAPYKGLESSIALTAWTRIDKLSSYDEERIRDFVQAFIGSGPEVNQVGCSVSDS